MFNATKVDSHFQWMILSDMLTTVDTTVLSYLVLRNKGSGLLSIVSKVVFKSQ